MAKALLLSFLLMVSCSSGPSLDELYEQRAQCVGDGVVDCSQYDEAITHKEDALARKEAREPPDCPPDSVAFCDRVAGSRCTKTQERATSNVWMCVRRDDILNGL